MHFSLLSVRTSFHQTLLPVFFALMISERLELVHGVSYRLLHFTLQQMHTRVYHTGTTKALLRHSQTDSCLKDTSILLSAITYYVMEWNGKSISWYNHTRSNVWDSWRWRVDQDSAKVIVREFSELSMHFPSIPFNQNTTLCNSQLHLGVKSAWP